MYSGDEKIVRGEFKREVGEVIIRNPELSTTIVQAFLDKGYDVTSKVTLGVNNYFEFETITIYRREKR